MSKIKLLSMQSAFTKKRNAVSTLFFTSVTYQNFYILMCPNTFVHIVYIKGAMELLVQYSCVPNESSVILTTACADLVCV